MYGIVNYFITSLDVLRSMIITMRKELVLLSWLHCAMKMPSTTLLNKFYRSLTTKGLLLVTLLILFFEKLKDRHSVVAT